MIFGPFKNWNEKILNKYKKHYPITIELYAGASLTKFRVAQLRKKLAIPSTGAEHRYLTAFYLGAIEGDIRKYVDMSKMTTDTLVETIFLIAMYTAVKDNDINNDGEWGALASEYNQVLFDKDNDWYRKRGLGFAGILGEDPEDNWSQFVARVGQISEA